MNTPIRTHERHLALVTGAGQGIGQAIALALAQRGAHVIVTDLKSPHETAHMIGDAAFPVQLDVTQEADWRSASAKSLEVGEVPLYRGTRSADVAKGDGYESRFALSEREILPPLDEKKKWGSFVGLSSNMVGLAIPGMSHYIASKMGIIGFMRGLANDVAGDGITANAVLHGLTNTQATAPQSEERKRGTWEQQAIKRMSEPEDVTGTILFLTSDDAAFITGQALVVDGGQYRVG